MLLVIAADGRGIGLAAINGDLVGDPMSMDGLCEKAECGFCIPVLREQKVNGLTGLIDRAIPVPPLACHPDSIRQLRPTGRLRRWNASANCALYFTTQRWIVAWSTDTRRAAMSSSTCRSLKGYATYHRTPISIIASGKWAPLKLSGIVSPPLLPPPTTEGIIPSITVDENLRQNRLQTGSIATHTQWGERDKRLIAWASVTSPSLTTLSKANSSSICTCSTSTSCTRSARRPRGARPPPPASPR